MEISQINVFGAGVFFVFIFLSGVWLRRNAKPYNGIKLNIHKFISLGAFYYLGRIAVGLHQSVGLSPTAYVMSITTGGLFVATIISGGLVSIDREMPRLVVLLHKITPFLTVISAISSLSFMLI
jgi:hypothetical protein